MDGTSGRRLRWAGGWPGGWTGVQQLSRCGHHGTEFPVRDGHRQEDAAAFPDELHGRSIRVDESGHALTGQGGDARTGADQFQRSLNHRGTLRHEDRGRGFGRHVCLRVCGGSSRNGWSERDIRHGRGTGHAGELEHPARGGRPGRTDIARDRRRLFHKGFGARHGSLLRGSSNRILTAC